MIAKAQRLTALGLSWSAIWCFSVQAQSGVDQVVSDFGCPIGQPQKNNDRLGKIYSDDQCIVPPSEEDGSLSGKSGEFEMACKNETLGHFECQDFHDLCELWARSGLCQKIKKFMSEECSLSCNLCSSEDGSGSLPDWHYGLGEDLGVPQELDVEESDEVGKEDILRAIEGARIYLKGHDQHLYGTGRCINLHPMCAWWSLTDECFKNAEYMAEYCAPMCRECDNIASEADDNMDEEVDEEEEEDEDFDCFEGLVDAWRPGDIEKTFKRLTSEPFASQYQVQILSSPGITQGPWIITIDGAISDEEIRTLIKAGTDIGYDPSVTTAGMNPSDLMGKTISPVRTSSTAWCDDDCLEDPVIHGVMQRLSEFAGIPSTNSESLQLLQYTRGQKYDVHHDMIPDDLMHPQGPRVLTAYIYLNDDCIGGGTRFDKFDLTVTPKRGRVLIWPSVMDSNMLQADDRTSHQALPVEGGTKYGANAFFHLNDFKKAASNFCLLARFDDGDDDDDDDDDDDEEETEEDEEE